MLLVGPCDRPAVSSQLPLLCLLHHSLAFSTCSRGGGGGSTLPYHAGTRFSKFQRWCLCWPASGKESRGRQSLPRLLNGAGISVAPARCCPSPPPPPSAALPLPSGLLLSVSLCWRPRPRPPSEGFPPRVKRLTSRVCPPGVEAPGGTTLNRERTVLQMSTCGSRC